MFVFCVHRYDRPEGSPALTCDFTFFDGIDDSEHDYEGVYVKHCIQSFKLFHF